MNDATVPPRTAIDHSTRTGLALAMCLCVGFGSLIGSLVAGPATRPAFAANAPANASGYVPLGAPTRISDSRDSAAAFDVVDVGVRRYRVAGMYGIPSDATAIAATITVVAHGADGFMTAYPSGPRPVASTSNYRHGAIVAATTIVGVANGSIDVYTMTTADVIVDVAGAFRPATTTGISTYSPATPRRLFDGYVTGGAVTQINPALPAAYNAVVVNVTITDNTSAGFVTVWGADGQPLASSLNTDRASETRANMSIVPTSSLISFVSQQPARVVVDLMGYFSDRPPGSTAGLYVPASGPRWVDTREVGGQIAGNSSRSFATPTYIPSDAAAVFATVTIVDSPDGWVSAVAAGQPRGTSTTNTNPFEPTLANGAFVALAGNQITVHTLRTTHLVIDIGGWFISEGPPSPPPTTTSPTTNPSTSTTPPVLAPSCTNLGVSTINAWRAERARPALGSSLLMYRSACRWASLMLTGATDTYSYWQTTAPAGWVSKTVTPGTFDHAPIKWSQYQIGQSGSPAGPAAQYVEVAENWHLAGYQDAVEPFTAWRNSPGHYEAATHVVYQTGGVAQACGTGRNGVYMCYTVAAFSSGSITLVP